MLVSGRVNISESQKTTQKHIKSPRIKGTTLLALHGVVVSLGFGPGGWNPPVGRGEDLHKACLPGWPS